jgi:prepilin-type N-terminal cleavage/methylation domain-containing protein
VALCPDHGDVHVRTGFRRARAEDHDAGVTLIEVLIAVVIISTAVVGLITGIMTAVRASDIHRREARSEVALRQYVENIEAGAYIPCPTATTSSFPVQTIDTYELRVIAVDKWNLNSNPPTFATGCATPDTGAERLTIQLTDPAAKVSKTVNVVVRSSS